MENPMSRHNYFGWPSAARLKDGRIAVAASGFRLSHICPFGKTVIAYSSDEGEKYTLPAPVIDTVLDDRDGAVLAFGDSGVLVASFNNTVDFQRAHVGRWADRQYRLEYLGLLGGEEEEKYLGSVYRISLDNGITFGELRKSPITSPHGPLECRDGRIIWVGRTFSPNDAMTEGDCVKAYSLDVSSGQMSYLGRIDDIIYEGEKLLSCEPYAIELEDGTLLCHIRAQRPASEGKGQVFTIYQSVSSDGGRSWSAPKRILSECGGAPSHIMRHSSGALISTYGYRYEPYGIKAMISFDNGKSWQTDIELYTNGVNGDLGYPSCVELSDGSIITVFYCHESPESPAVIMQQRWRLEL